ncbi:MAG: MEDS domain-containing protein, partial [Candidatus Bathyarchaeota archaeon]|nr:MEDS domain-containing protein [Candidatus Bathyarchaeota archaeon]
RTTLVHQRFDKMQRRLDFGKTLDYVRGLKTGDHGIVFYRSLNEKHEVLFNFLQSGLQKGEGAIYVSSQETSKQIRRRMEDFGLNVKALESDGALRILDYDEFYIIDGEVNAPHTIMLGMRMFEEAMDIGLKGLHTCGEAACFFEHKKEKELVEYELGLGRKLDLPVTVLCAYDVNHAKSLEEKLFFSLIKAHGPVVTTSFAQEVTFENFFPTIMEDVLETVFGEMGKEVILIMLDKRHSLTPGERERRVAEDPMSFVEGLEELVGSGAVVIEKSVAREMLWKMGIT